MKGWTNLDSIGQFDEIIDQSSSQAIVIFKHSTRCSISSMAQRRLNDLDPNGLNASFYYLDLIAHRDVSNYIAEKLDEHHESPQILVVKNGSCDYVASHMEITARDIIEQI